MSLPEAVVHADWSVQPAGRWAARAGRDGAGGYLLDAPEPATVASLLDRGRGDSVLLGLDVNLGVPEHYARLVGMTSFPRWLAALSEAELAELADPARRADEITAARPFYPRRPGAARQAHLVQALGAAHLDDLRRVCERRPPLARAACPLFWTLGANQVGRATVTAWRELVRPARRRPEGARLWPFDGPLDELLDGDGLTLAEAYPAASARALGLGRVSKRDRGARQGCAPALAAHLAALGVRTTPAFEEQLAAGFPNDHAFDAVLGVLGLLGVVVGRWPAHPDPWPSAARSVEGWILGLDAAPAPTGI